MLPLKLPHSRRCLLRFRSSPGSSSWSNWFLTVVMSRLVGALRHFFYFVPHLFLFSSPPCWMCVPWPLSPSPPDLRSHSSLTWLSEGPPTLIPISFCHLYAPLRMAGSLACTVIFAAQDTPPPSLLCPLAVYLSSRKKKAGLCPAGHTVPTSFLYVHPGGQNQPWITPHPSEGDLYSAVCVCVCLGGCVFSSYLRYLTHSLPSPPVCTLSRPLVISQALTSKWKPSKWTGRKWNYKSGKSWLVELWSSVL